MPGDEDLTGLNANAIQARRSKPFLTLVALMAILDPPRDECIEAVKVAHRAGITVKMITGMTGLLVGLPPGRLRPWCSLWNVLDGRRRRRRRKAETPWVPGAWGAMHMSKGCYRLAWPTGPGGPCKNPRN